MFVNRERELTQLSQFVEQPGAHFIIVYGRRRMGKTTLLTTWADQTGLPTLYWVAKRDPQEALMANLARTIRRPLTASRAMTLAALVDAPETVVECRALMSLLGTRADLEQRASRWAETHRREARVEAKQLGLWEEE